MNDGPFGTISVLWAWPGGLELPQATQWRLHQWAVRCCFELLFAGHCDYLWLNNRHVSMDCPPTAVTPKGLPQAILLRRFILIWTSSQAMAACWPRFQSAHWQPISRHWQITWESFVSFTQAPEFSWSCQDSLEQGDATQPAMLQHSLESFWPCRRDFGRIQMNSQWYSINIIYMYTLVQCLHPIISRIVPHNIQCIMAFLETL